MPDFSNAKHAFISSLQNHLGLDLAGPKSLEVDKALDKFAHIVRAAVISEHKETTDKLSALEAPAEPIYHPDIPEA